MSTTYNSMLDRVRDFFSTGARVLQTKVGAAVIAGALLSIGTVAVPAPAQAQTAAQSVRHFCHDNWYIPSCATGDAERRVRRIENIPHRFDRSPDYWRNQMRGAIRNSVRQQQREAMQQQRIIEREEAAIERREYRDYMAEQARQERAYNQEMARQEREARRGVVVAPQAAPVIRQPDVRQPVAAAAPHVAAPAATGGAAAGRSRHQAELAALNGATTNVTQRFDGGQTVAVRGQVEGIPGMAGSQECRTLQTTAGGATESSTFCRSRATSGTAWQRNR